MSKPRKSIKSKKGRCDGKQVFESLEAATARREIGKWLNEEQTKPVDRVALAQLCAGFDRLARPLASEVVKAEVDAAYNVLSAVIHIDHQAATVRKVIRASLESFAASRIEQVLIATPPGGAGGSGRIADHLFIEQRGDGIWLVCVEKVHSTREQAQASCHAWQTLTRGAVEIDMKSLVNRFLTWPVPASVYPDGTPGQPGRTGTNLLNYAEAKEMLEHVLATPAQSVPLSGGELVQQSRILASHQRDLVMSASKKVAAQIDALCDEILRLRAIQPQDAKDARPDSFHSDSGECDRVQGPGTTDAMNYKGMWLAAVSTLAKIDALLGLPEDGCNDPDMTLSALQDYIAGIKDIVGSSAFTIEDVRGWIAQGQARALAIDPDAAILAKGGDQGEGK